MPKSNQISNSIFRPDFPPLRSPLVTAERRIGQRAIFPAEKATNRAANATLRGRKESEPIVSFLPSSRFFSPLASFRASSPFPGKWFFEAENPREQRDEAELSRKEALIALVNGPLRTRMTFDSVRELSRSFFAN